MMKLKSERDVRIWTKNKAGSSVFWIEAARGGTFGFTDTVIVQQGRIAFLELKFGRWLAANGQARFSLRKGQKPALRRLQANGACAGVLVGLPARDGVGPLLAVLRPGPVAWGGQINIYGLKHPEGLLVEADDPWAWEDVMNFVMAQGGR